MNFSFTKTRRDPQAMAPLLESGSDEDHPFYQAPNHSSISSGYSPSATSTRGAPVSSLPRTLNLQLGPLEPSQFPGPKPRTEIDQKIRDAFEDLEKKRAVYLDIKLSYAKVIHEIDRLARQYIKEEKKAPIYPPKGTWFHAERKQFARKKAEHEEKLRFILRVRQTVIDSEPKEMERLSTARDVMGDAQAKLDALRREKKLREI